MPESLKNILLVMADGGYLVPPSGDEKASEIWTETWKRVDRFLPDLFAEIFPKANPPPTTATAAKDAEKPFVPSAEPYKEIVEDPPAPVEPSKNDRGVPSAPDVQALT